ncbi:MAG: UDP-N-acetylmuramate--alanine ligase [Actinomycetota bacterium]|nr:UDP-N-acetylmuramate--alanine ligase [Actinomycetota bacterium]
MKPDLSVEVPPADRLTPVHFIAIGGVGMSGIARIMADRGLAVSGSDAKDSPVLGDLRAAGATVWVGHDAAHLDGVRSVVVSSAVRESNPELLRARADGLVVLHRSQALASVMAGRRVLAVAGTHGKTTTTSMATVAARHAGADPSYAVGGELVDGGGNAHEGTGEVFVAEADESDGSFLVYSPEVSVITNVEPDHLDHYGSPEAVEEAFDAFADRVTPGGTLVFCADDPGAARVARRAAARRGDDLRIVGYGTGPAADVRLEGLPGEQEPGEQRPGEHGPGGAVGGDDGCLRFRLTHGDTGTAEISLRLPGRHNALDAAAAWTATVVGLGLDGDEIAAGLGSFSGTRRRFEAKGAAGGVRVFDDYAHHPTEVAAVLRAARTVAGNGRVLAAFQPHLFSRTRIFAAEFADALGLADEVVVLDVFGAREDPEPGVTGALIADRVPLPPGSVAFVPDAGDVPGELARRVRPGDVVLTIGAGDVTRLGPLVVEEITARVAKAPE